MVCTPLPLTVSAEVISPDDFKRIKGIGPAVERALHNAGILSFAQLAALSPADIGDLISHIAGLSVERIAQQDWVGQAGQLAARSAEPQPHQREQHYATFTMELLLDEANQVQRTRISHVQEGVEETWAGWEEAGLLNFITRQADFDPHPPVPAPQPHLPASQGVSLPPPPATKTDSPGKLGLRRLVVLPVGFEDWHNFLDQGQPFEVYLALDLTKLNMSAGDALNYKITINARKLGENSPQIIAEANGVAAIADMFTLKMAGSTLPAGLYRLEAAVTLTFPANESDLSVRLEGSLLQIY